MKSKPKTPTIGTITPEQFARGEVFWGSKHKSKKVRSERFKVIKPMAEDIVNSLLENK